MRQRLQNRLHRGREIRDKQGKESQGTNPVLAKYLFFTVPILQRTYSSTYLFFNAPILQRTNPHSAVTDSSSSSRRDSSSLRNASSSSYSSLPFSSASSASASFLKSSLNESSRHSQPQPQSDRLSDGQGQQLKPKSSLSAASVTTLVTTSVTTSDRARDTRTNVQKENRVKRGEKKGAVSNSGSSKISSSSILDYYAVQSTDSITGCSTGVPTATTASTTVGCTADSPVINKGSISALPLRERLLIKKSL